MPLVQYHCSIKEKAPIWKYYEYNIILASHPVQSDRLMGTLNLRLEATVGTRLFNQLLLTPSEPQNPCLHYLQVNCPKNGF